MANCISVLDKPSKSSKFRVQSSKLEKQGKYLSENFLLVIHISYLITFLLIFALFPSASAAIKDRALGVEPTIFLPTAVWIVNDVF